MGFIPQGFLNQRALLGWNVTAQGLTRFYPYDEYWLDVNHGTLYVWRRIKHTCYMGDNDQLDCAYGIGKWEVFQALPDEAYANV